MSDIDRMTRDSR